MYVIVHPEKASEIMDTQVSHRMLSIIDDPMNVMRDFRYQP